MPLARVERPRWRFHDRAGNRLAAHDAFAALHIDRRYIVRHCDASIDDVRTGGTGRPADACNMETYRLFTPIVFSGIQATGFPSIRSISTRTGPRDIAAACATHQIDMMHIEPLRKIRLIFKFHQERGNRTATDVGFRDDPVHGPLISAISRSSTYRPPRKAARRVRHRPASYVRRSSLCIWVRHLRRRA